MLLLKMKKKHKDKAVAMARAVEQRVLRYQFESWVAQTAEKSIQMLF